MTMMAIEKCRELDINVSIASVLMSNNHSYFPKFKDILDKYDINLRINLYKSVNGKDFTASYEQFWRAMKDISKNFEVVSCSEPVLAVVYGEVKNGSRCGSSVRIHPDGNISSCVYVKNNDSLETFNRNKIKLPAFCTNCPYEKNCMGGCFGRRITENRPLLPDSYCPFYNGMKVPKIKFKKSKKTKDLIHSNYLCTMVLR